MTYDKEDNLCYCYGNLEEFYELFHNLKHDKITSIINSTEDLDSPYCYISYDPYTFVVFVEIEDKEFIITENKQKRLIIEFIEDVRQLQKEEENGL